MKFKLFILISLIFIPLVFAQEVNFDKAYNWLYPQSPTDVTEAALMAMAIHNIDTVKAQPFIDYITNNKNPNQFCWPKTSCDTSSTAFVLIAINSGITIEGVTATEVKSWLELNQQLAPLPSSGKWYLQILTSGSGTCGLFYTKRGNTNPNAQIQLTVDKGIIKSNSCTAGSTLLDINSCISSDILSKPSTKMRITCSDGLSDAKISILYYIKDSNSYYLVSESTSQSADITINNGYYGDLDKTYYANWALKLSDSDVNSLLYLKMQQKEHINDVKYLSALYLITSNNYYLTKLDSLKSQINGYYGQPNLWDNTLAVLALKQAGNEFSSVQTWFASQQNTDLGYWEKGSPNKKTTALILYALGGTATLPECITGRQKSCGEVGVCKNSLQTCTSDGTWPGCSQDMIKNYSPIENCGDSLDNNCDGSIDEGCDCDPAVTPKEECGTDTGICVKGTKTCDPITRKWTACQGGVQPSNEICSNGRDDNCNSLTDCEESVCQVGSDWDNDGIPNDQDNEKCTPYGCSVWKQSDNVRKEFLGLAKDTDQDVVCDSLDKCLNTESGCQAQTYGDDSPGCPADCNTCTSDPFCACSDCGAGLFSICTNDVCLSLGEKGNGCVFKPAPSIFSYSYCYDCAGKVTSCSSYLTQLDCETNQCLDKNNVQCIWDSALSVCKLKPKINYYKDGDKDGFGSQTNVIQTYTQPEDYITESGDCNDNNPNINQEATESCDGIDNNCKNGIDEGCSCIAGKTQSCSQGKYGVCVQAQSQTCTSDGTWPGCDYTSIQGYQSEETLCDSIDNDCDKTIDEGCLCVKGTQRNCAVQIGVCKGLKETCGDGTWPGCDYTSIQGYQSEETLCDGIDNDCDGTIDENNCACIDGTTRACANQQGVCLGSKEICTNGIWPGCTKTDYGLNYAEIESTQDLCSDSKDNDCDSLIDCLDQSCPNGGDFDKDRICNLKDNDKDGDGVPNTNDKEEFTTLGCKVNTYDPNNLGKQLDLDNDKICDGLDKCENTILSCLVQGYDEISPGCPADCEVATCVADPACECKTCSDCITGTFDFCSQEECSVCGQGTCWFQPKDFAKDTCETCTTATSCSTYPTQTDCVENPCQKNIGWSNCTWSSDVCCKDDNNNGICDNQECTPEWNCGPWSTCGITDTIQRRLCTDDAQCGISCPTNDPTCITERACNACTPQWQCNDWSECINGIQARDCRDINNCAHICPSDDTSCLEQRSCGTCTPDWECTIWSDCNDGIKTRSCEDKNNCNIACSINEADCIEEQLCTTEEEPVSSCGNTLCEAESGENQATCPSDCTPTNPCVVNGNCETQFGEDENNCAEDCKEEGQGPQDTSSTSFCGDGICDTNEDSTLCPDDCPKSGGEGTTGGTTPSGQTGSKLWIFIILFILLGLLIVVYFLFFKKPSSKSGKNKSFGSLGSLLPQPPQRQPLFGPQTSQSQQTRGPILPSRERPKKSIVEDELEKSIKEAKKLLGK